MRRNVELHNSGEARRSAYIRLNVTVGLRNVVLDEAAKTDRIVVATRRYDGFQEFRIALRRLRVAVADFDADAMCEEKSDLLIDTVTAEPASASPVHNSPEPHATLLCVIFGRNPKGF